jgi:hypothetical protein
LNAIIQISTTWKNLTEDTKHGIKANMDRIMANYSNSSLRPFLTGIGSNSVEVGELWNRISAFNLNTDAHGAAGKLILLFIKTLINEEAVKRQIRFSKRQIELTKYFVDTYPELLVLETSPESIPLDWVSNQNAVNGQTSMDLHNQFIDTCMEIQACAEVKTKDGNQEWERGQFLSKVRVIAEVNARFDDILDELVAPNAKSLATKALKIAEEFFKRNPRFKDKVKGFADINPEIFTADALDDHAWAAKKVEGLKKYYDFKNISTKIDREHFFFICDEYQQLITVDPTGGCYTDSDFPNISRSTNVKLFLATQSKAAFKAKIGADIMDNFLSQMSSRIYLTNKDKDTVDDMVFLAGECDVFRNPIQGQKLKNNDVVQEGYSIYKNFNSYLSNCIEQNKAGQSGADGYPYKFDAFARAEPIDIEFKNFSFKNAFSSIFTSDSEFKVNSLKDHFVSTKHITDYVERGSAATELTNNADQIKQEYKTASSSAKQMHSDFLEKGYEPRSKILSESDIAGMGNIHAFVSIVRAGMTKKDHIIISSDGFYEVEQ